MSYENNNERNTETHFSKRLKAGKRRTYFFDVRSTKGNDYFITLTESKKRFNDSGYDRHKIFIYKEDFNKFIKALGEAIDHVKTELMPDYDFDAFNHEYPEDEAGENNYVKSENQNLSPEMPESDSSEMPSAPSNDIEVDKW